MQHNNDIEKDHLLAEWSARVADELALGDFAVDIDAVLGLAGIVAHAVLRPAAPLTTFLVGYAAGLAAASGEETAERAAVRATAQVTALANAVRATATADAAATGTPSDRDTPPGEPR